MEDLEERKEQLGSWKAKRHTHTHTHTHTHILCQDSHYDHIIDWPDCFSYRQFLLVEWFGH